MPFYWEWVGVGIRLEYRRRCSAITTPAHYSPLLYHWNEFILYQSWLAHINEQIEVGPDDSS